MSDFLSFKPADVTAPGLQDLSAGAAHDVAIALAEDVAQGDLTANLIDPATQAHARIVAREAAVVCGRPWVEAAFAAKQVTLLRADWTRRDPAITRALEQLGRSGVPVYVLYAPRRSPQVLTELLTPGEVLGTLATL